MIEMKTHFTGLALAALLTIGSTLPGYTEDAAKPAVSAAPPAAQTETPPPSVPRPSLAPKTAEPAPTPAAEPASRPHRRYARRHQWRYGYYRTAYWEPFPIFWPHLYRHRVHWNRIPWMFRF
jgi:hypothetical protein